MYGMLLESIQHYIKELHGEGVWDQIRFLAGVEHHVFVTHQRYSDAIFQKLAEGSAKVLGKEMGWGKDDFMQFFGKCFVKFFSNYGYDKVIKVFGRHLRDFLNGIDTIHEQMRFGYPKMESPTFHCTEETSTGLTLHYRSKRKGFKHYVIGQMHEVVKQFYDMSIQIDILAITETTNQCHVAYRLTFDNHASKPLAPDLLSLPVIHEAPNLKSMPLENFFNIFPFSFVISANMRISMAGHSLLSILGKELLGAKVTDAFTLRRPKTEFTWENLQVWRAAFELVSNLPSIVETGAVRNIEKLQASYHQARTDFKRKKRLDSNFNGVQNKENNFGYENRIPGRAKELSWIKVDHRSSGFGAHGLPIADAKESRTTKRQETAKNPPEEVRQAKKSEKVGILSRVVDNLRCIPMLIDEDGEEVKDVASKNGKRENKSGFIMSACDTVITTEDGVMLRNGSTTFVRDDCDGNDMYIDTINKDVVWVKQTPHIRPSNARKYYKSPGTHPVERTERLCRHKNSNARTYIQNQEKSDKEVCDSLSEEESDGVTVSLPSPSKRRDSIYSDSPQDNVKKQPRIHLKGEMKYIKQNNKVLFVCSPVIGGFNEMMRCGVYMSDLGMHDRSQEMVLSGIQPLQQLEYARDQLLEKSRELEKNMKRVERERMRSNQLLYQMIPKQIADRLKEGQDAIDTCQHFDCVTILFSYLDGFVQLCSHVSAMEVVSVVNTMFTVFDKLSEKHDVYKFETLGDAIYMAVSGAPVPKARHAEPMAAMALDMIDAMDEIKKFCSNALLTITIGMHSGAVVAGVVGKRTPQYCLFGHTVNIASRLRTTALPMRIHISNSCNECLLNTEFHTEFRGTILLKGIQGEMKTYWLIGRERKNLTHQATTTNEPKTTDV
ncbi:soluble guanylate cyclase 89Db isoform X1 [Nematostella vectensis]|uniref:soluble guanylate cyclase 89Db isoform X1 n=2 Tax=Nematostella vectensis TaxID=45351 RepID=UPI00138FFD0D|nr:soluble guanylate cyclase 89Db isoform X1 [Nematostella vectensis]XP_032237322.1 soluble guanylate cyclase 89Db isoform X1 [Nematostella vectensis]XP_032237323.1 soluble guanylate cyclase 89Db isoform X1 [Nematostella vectensis]XP_048581318.1 soluble guanylate cyclase 89Db isoform X1 [Nematostella vectensis]